ncbi:hypothetical protein CASFOL_020929 [Castilleja foliolosa]|uniref:ATP-dependent DNA helicase n=1 Tax=Castilleja foliolosa TaxID=1961234 RepID=A0ABD3D3T1_9LAMI
MVGKRQFDASSYEVGESSRRRTSRRLSQITSSGADYLDNGDCDCVCEHCAALFWFAERATCGSTVLSPKYTHCCKRGSIRLPLPPRPPDLLKQLFDDDRFMENIRAYNNMFAMTSFGAQIDDAVNDGRGPYVFKVSGQISHWIGSLCPPDNQGPRFLQMYISDTFNEVSNRMRLFNRPGQCSLSEDVVQNLSSMLSSCNEYARLFRNAADLCDPSADTDFSIRLYNNVGDRRYTPPEPGTLGGIVRADDLNATGYDIIIHSKDGPPQRVSKLHPSYIPLQYPLLFPFAEQGWSPNLTMHSNSSARERRLTVNMYYSYQIQDRYKAYSLLLRGGRLLQQYLVDAYTCIEQNRLDYINANQNIFRSEFVAGMYDALARGDRNVNDIGKRIFLPSSFTGGPRYMYQHYQDALAICRVHGNPQYFVTFTCNVKWPEISRHMSKVGTVHAQNRPDIIARVFHIKVQEFFKFIKSEKPFGEVAAAPASYNVQDLYTIEFQKRGLPHCHALIWVTTPYKIHDAASIDRYVTAEIPDPSVHPVLHKVITDYMIHGPCGLARPSSPCMRDGKCTKSFPKNFESLTRFDRDGYAHYRRQPGEYYAIKNGVVLDNRSNDTDIAGTTNNPVRPLIDEIKNYVDGRFICPHEASWRILNFPIHARNPAVELLAVHLEDMQNVTFRENLRLEAVIRNPLFGKTTLTEWIRSNCRNQDGRTLTYVNYPTKYRWDKKAKCWTSRMYTTRPAIGRLTYVHPSSGELFYLRMLLCHQQGCMSFADIRTVSGTVHVTYFAACEALGLIGDDREWATAFIEASIWATASELRALFTHMLLLCEVGHPLLFWETHWRCMSDDIRRHISSQLSDQHQVVSDENLQQHVLVELEKLLNSSTPSKSLSDFGLPLPSGHTLASLGNRLLLEETCYDRAAMAAATSHSHALLNNDQRKVYDCIMSSYETNSQILLFVYGHGGTGKTFLWTTILTFFRSIGKIILAVAASGIASLLLPSGRTAHSRFKIPIELTDRSTCHIKKNTHLSELLQQTTLIIWDEAPMSDRRCFECLDRTLRDITGNNDQPFGGKSVLLGGDFRQTLPVRVKCTRAEIINSTLPRSYLWPYFRLFRLHENMRLTAQADNTNSTRMATEFASWLLKVGDGLIGESDINDPLNTRNITIPPQYLIPSGENRLHSLINFIYDESLLVSPSPAILSTRAIVCPTNDATDDINKLVLTLTPGECKIYTSNDVITPHSENRRDLEASYPPECLSQMNFPGIPPHQLTLKVNTPVMLIRNINQSLGLCNGTRLIITQMLPRVIEAQIITGTSKGTRVYIPRIKFVHDNKELPFVFTRRQFPIKVCYAMTINKSQGQSLKKIGVYLRKPVFTHGQLYVALSRATSLDSLRILIEPTEGNSIDITKNVVFSDFIEEINNRFVDVYGDCVEATAEVKHIEYFDSVVHLNCCYKVSNYICVSPRPYMATIDHGASLLLGLKTKSTPIESTDIPTSYFNFATYDTLKGRINNLKLLTDYIGRVGKNCLRNTSTGKTLRKTQLHDESGNKVEITLWPDKRHLIGDEVAAGDIVVITSTKVTEHNGMLQLESTNLTTVLLNPDLPETMEHVNRLMTLPVPQEQNPDEKMVTIADLLPNNLATKESVKGCTNLTCRATIVQLYENKGWYYVTCPKCSGKMYSQQQNGQTIFVCRDDDDVTPTFKYSVNAKIMDDTGAIDAVFFNDSMNAMLHISCSDMITKHGHKDSKILPHLMTSIMSKPWLLHLGQKIDGTVVVNNVTGITTANSYETADEEPGISTLTPTTPTPKKGTSKRQEALTPDTADRRKAKKI